MITKHDDVCFAVSESNSLVVGAPHVGLQYQFYVLLIAVSRESSFRSVESFHIPFYCDNDVRNFAYINHLTPKTRREILELLVTGLKRLEYRGYDSAGVAIDSPDQKDIAVVKNSGKVAALEEVLQERSLELSLEECVESHCGIAHTRWATHGEPSAINSHPQRSGEDNAFVVIHNGIITNYKAVKTFLENKGYVFESQTDTEAIAKLVHHIYHQHKDYSFQELVEQVIQQLEGAFALCLKSATFQMSV